MRKINLTRKQLLGILRDNGFEKKATAKQLGVDETSVRRACTRLEIDVELEKSAAVADKQYQTFPTESSKKNVKVNNGTFIVIPDLHAHEVIWDYLGLVCKFIEDFKPEYVIQLGDLMDYECLLGIGKKRYPAFDGKDVGRLNREFQACAKIITMINQASPAGSKKIFLEGNHEYRVTELLHKAPEFEDMFRLDKRVDMTGWEILPYLQKFKLGKLNFIHGEFYGISPVKKHLAVYDKNIVFGHTHAIGQETKPSPMREIPVWGAMLGCLCKLNADYMKNKSSRAEHGFGYGWFEEKSGDFDCAIKRIIHGGFWAEGRRYKV